MVFFRETGSQTFVGVCLICAIFLWGCAGGPVSDPAPPRPEGTPRPYRVGSVWYQPLSDSKNFKQRGIASWYGKDFHGKRTSNGEIYDMHAMTAAHKTLPLGVYVRVKNLRNHRVTTVRINDRGPFVRGRVIDLSYLAARKLGIVGPGTAPVEIVALGAPVPATVSGKGTRSYLPLDYYSGNFTIQVGAFKNRQNAEKLMERLARSYANAHITAYFSGRETFYRVRVGRYSTLDEVMASEKYFIEKGFIGAFGVAE